MEDKDPKDDELNPKGQDDANDADDSFGLPDLDYKALDDDENEPEAQEEEEGTTETSEENEHTEEEMEESEMGYVSDEESESSFEERREEPQLRYQMEETSSNGPKILIGILIILVIAAGIWYFGFYKPKQDKLAEEARMKQELIDKQKAAEAEAEALKKQQLAALAAEAARLAAEAEAKAKAGVQTITERTGRYYIVVNSFVDGDLAKDYGNMLAKNGTPSFLIPPYSKKKLQRVAIGGYDTMEEAQRALSGAMPEGVKPKGNWILKY
ncbi:MAG: SPOR domain-containing protein [Cyclobacteriaceae bacterium]|nr:SPOR domain-containing protein [Cyclobacteriaceae bacterium]